MTGDEHGGCSDSGDEHGGCRDGGDEHGGCNHSGSSSAHCPSLASDDLEEASCKHTMFVVPISTLLEFDSIPSYEELSAAGKLAEWRKGMRVAFISHVWLGTDHPDPGGDKLALLRTVLVRAMAGQLEPAPHWTLALTSSLGGFRHKLHKLRGHRLHSFVHCPLHTLPGPRWRVEAFGRQGSRPPRLAWTRLVPHGDAIQRSRPKAEGHHHRRVCFRRQTMWGSGGVLTRGWVACGVASGAFTDDRDRTSLGPVILSLIARREAQALKEGDVTFYRRLHAVTGKVLDSTGLQPEQPASLDDFLVSTGQPRFEHALDRSPASPLHCAVMTGRADLVAALLDKGVDVETPMVGDDSRFEGAVQGMTALHVACILQDGPELVKLLLARGADPAAPNRRRGGMRLTALHFACMGGRVRNVDALLAHDPSLAYLKGKFGGKPLSMP